MKYISLFLLALAVTFAAWGQTSTIEQLPDATAVALDDQLWMADVSASFNRDVGATVEQLLSPFAADPAQFGDFDPVAWVDALSITSDWSDVTGTPTTLSGYGITDAYTQSAADTAFATAAQGALADTALQVGDALLWSDITGTPTTLSGYGITDAAAQSDLSTLQPLDADLTALSAAGNSGALSLIDQDLSAGAAPVFSGSNMVDVLPPQSALTDPGTGIVTWDATSYQSARLTTERNTVIDVTRPFNLSRLVIKKGSSAHTLTLSETLASGSANTLAEFDSGATDSVWSVDLYHDDVITFCTLTQLTNPAARKMVFSWGGAAKSGITSSATGGTWEAYGVTFVDVTSGEATIFGHDMDSVAHDAVSVSCLDDGRIRVRFGMGGLNENRPTGITITEGRPFDVIFSWTGTGHEIRVRQDSASWETFSESLGATTMTPGEIGLGCLRNASGQNAFFEGSIKQIILRDENGDIQAQYDDFQPGDTDWPDQSGEGNDATLIGTPGNTFAAAPNVIFILADDLGYRELPMLPYGNAAILTPELDTMASEGMRFSDFYACGPVCMPTRSSFLTGKDQRSAPSRGNATLPIAEEGPPFARETGYDHPMPASAYTIAEMLGDNGYRTAAFGKWGLGGPYSVGEPSAQGFDYFLGLLGHVEAWKNYSEGIWREGGELYYLWSGRADDEGGTMYYEGATNGYGNSDREGNYGQWRGNLDTNDLFIHEAHRFIRDSHNRGEPFFAYLALIPPHLQTHAPAKLERLQDDDGLLVDYSVIDNLYLDEIYPGSPFNDPAGVGIPDFELHGYASEISWLSRETGRIMDLLTELGIAENTLLIFTSDNGHNNAVAGAAYFAEDTDQLQAGIVPLRGDKSEVTEGGIRVPMIAWWPGTIPADQTSDLVCSIADFYPTFCEMIGVTPPSDLTGESMLSVLQGGANPALSPDRWLYFNTFNRKAVRYGDWKLYQSGTGAAYELYDLSTDIAETTDVSAANPTVVAQLKRLLWGSMEPPDDFFFESIKNSQFYARNNINLAYAEVDGEDAYELTPSGTGTVFNYIPALDGYAGALTFVAKIQFSSASTASFMVSDSTTVADALEISIDNSAEAVVISYPGMTTVSQSLSVGDIASNLATIELNINTSTGVGSVEIGTTTINFNTGSIADPIEFWGYEVISAAVSVTRPIMAQS